MKITFHLEITCHSIKLFFSMFIQLFFLKFTVLRKGEVSTLKVPFTLSLKLTKIKSEWNNQEKTLKITKNICNETFVYEQKPIKIDDFNETEEKEVKERVEKRKIKRREVAEKNKLF